MRIDPAPSAPSMAAPVGAVDATGGPLRLARGLPTLRRMLSTKLWIVLGALGVSCSLRCGSDVDITPKASPCSSDGQRLATCENWKPGSKPYCYEEARPGHDPSDDLAPGTACGGMATPDRFGAPPATPGPYGQWDWWCCIQPDTHP